MSDDVQKDGDNFTTDAVYAAKIKWSEIDWTMKWGPNPPKGKPLTEPRFEEGLALAVLLVHEVVFLNSFQCEGDWPKEARKKTSLSVNCNDIFAWGCADAEELDYSEIQDLWNCWKKDPDYGSAVWCMKKRNQMPQRPVLNSIIKGGLWDVGQLKKDLRVNYYDTVSSMVAKAQYAAYAAWCTETDVELKPFDKHWWAGWKDYVVAHPKWREMDWYKDSDKEIQRFIDEYNKTPSSLTSE